MTEEEFRKFQESGGDPEFLKKFIKLEDGEVIEDWEKASTIYSASGDPDVRKGTCCCCARLLGGWWAEGEGRGADVHTHTDYFKKQLYLCHAENLYFVLCYHYEDKDYV